MCFSAEASFISAAILVPVGLYCLKKTVHMDKPYWTFSLLPMVFGIQQAFEGGVWWALDANEAEILRLSALGFLFISHFFWLVWIPVSSYFTETIQKRRAVFLSIAGAGFVFSATMFPPFLFYPDWISVSMVDRSIIYQTTLIYDDYIPRYIITGIYMLIVMIPLLLSSDQYHRMLGILILFSAAVTILFFNIAFISVWCYFAAVISLFVYYMTVKLKGTETLLKV